MSAIWGAINLHGGEIPVAVQEKMREAFSKCVIDRYEEIREENVYMGCGIQYFKELAVKELLPVREGAVFCTADVVLDNRGELFDRLHIPEERRQDMPDGALLFAMYQRFGRACLNDLLGAYTFVWYDREKNRVEMVLDAVGNRCLYYRFEEGILYFSSLIEPLAQLTPKPAANDRWMVDFLAMDHLYMVNETTETPLQGIFRIAPAQYLCFTTQGVDGEIYWNPFAGYEEYHYASDEQYKQEFRTVWDAAVTCVMDTAGEIAIQLSGGLDSTSVAAVAAPYLARQGRKLYSFTSVPVAGYGADNSGYYITDESEDVRKTAEFFGNIEPEFLDMEGKNAWELADRELAILEMPYKSVQNSQWLVETMRRAYDKGARMILSGSYGNTTISYTMLNVYMNTLFHRKQYGRLKRELEAFGGNMGFSPRYAWKEIYHTARQAYEPSPYPYGHSFVKRELAEKLGVRKRLEDMHRENFEDSRDYEKFRHHMVHFLALRQIGELVTKHSLSTGVLMRDPTKDRRVIEFCLHLPVEQFSREGIDRRLVKVYLRDKLPPHVIRFQKQGRQSADICYRIGLQWERIRREWIALYATCADSRYVDTRLARRQLLEKTDISQYTDFDITRQLYTLFVLKYEAYIRRQNGQTAGGQKESGDIQPLLSVIIPVYNVGCYLEQCVHSVCEQTYRHLEILLIDDGSTDGSGELCDELAKGDGRIQVFHQTNSGVAAARNLGLRCAKGELIAFVDGDDWLESVMYEKLYTLLCEQNAEIACCGYRLVQDGQETDHSKGEVSVFYGREMFDAYITGGRGCLITPTVWNRLYRRTLFDGLRFPPLKKYEDYMLSTELFARVEKGVYLDKAFYHYRMRSDSLSHAKLTAEDVQAYLKAGRRQNRLAAELLCRTSQRANLFRYDCILLTMYCKAAKSGQVELEKLLGRELRRIGREARESIWSRMDIGTRDKLSMVAATYSPKGYARFLLH